MIDKRMSENELISELTKLYEDSNHYVQTILLARNIITEYRKSLKAAGTFCCTCAKHFPLEEFVWEGTNERVGS